jgi:hypothetical protein
VFFVSADSKGVAGELLVSADSKRVKVAVFSARWEWLVSADPKGFIGVFSILISILIGTADSKGVRGTDWRGRMVNGHGRIVPIQRHDYSIVVSYVNDNL